MDTRAKRLLSVILAIVMCMSCLAFVSCGQKQAGGDTSSDSTAPTATSAAETTTTLPPVTTTAAPPADKKVVVIGGGPGSVISSAVVKLTEKTNPRILLFPTAGKDSVSSCLSLQTQFKSYSDDIEVITLCLKIYDPEELRQKILGADLIYVAGGETEFLMNCWKKFKVDTYLREAYEKGVVLAGSSAGAICWTIDGFNDFNEHPTRYAFCEGIGILPIYFGPHFQDADFYGFDAALKAIPKPASDKGYALENGTALIFENGVCRAVREAESDHIYEYTYANGAWTKAEFVY